MKRLPVRSWAVGVVSAVLAFAVLFSWSWDVALVVAVFVTGVFAGLFAPSSRASLVLGALSGLLGGVAGAMLYADGVPRALVSQGAAVALGGMPSLYALLTRLGEHGPVTIVGSLGPAPFVLVSTVATTAVAASTGLLLARTGRKGRARRLLVAAIVAVACASFANTAWQASAPAVANASREPVDGQYAYDAIIYLKTYHLMLKGQDYYSAIRDASAADARYIDKHTVEDGRFVRADWAWGPGAIRKPTIFYVWRYAAPGGASGILALAIAGSALLLAAMAWALAPYLAERSALVTVLAMPYVLFMTLGRNVFFPDYWGALLSMLALLLVMRKRWLPAAAVLLLSALVRETAGPSLAAMTAVSLWLWLRTGRPREWLVRTGAFAAGVAAWFGSERLNEALAARLFAFRAFRSSAQLLFQLAASRSLEKKVLPAANYLVPGGAVPLRGVLLILLAVGGYRAVLASEREARFAVVAYLVFWLGWLVVMGAGSEYWGQTIVLPAMVGSACLLLSADRLDTRGEMPAALTWE